MFLRTQLCAEFPMKSQFVVIMWKSLCGTIMIVIVTHLPADLVFIISTNAASVIKQRAGKG